MAKHSFSFVLLASLVLAGCAFAAPSPSSVTEASATVKLPPDLWGAYEDEWTEYELAIDDKRRVPVRMRQRFEFAPGKLRLVVKCKLASGKMLTAQSEVAALFGGDRVNVEEDLKNVVSSEGVDCSASLAKSELFFRKEGDRILMTDSSARVITYKRTAKM